MKEKAIRKKLSQKELFQLGTWLTENQAYLNEVGIAMQDVAKLASEKLGFTVTMHHISYLSKNLEIHWKLDRKKYAKNPSSTSNRLVIKYVRVLYSCILGFNPEGLSDLLNRKIPDKLFSEEEKKILKAELPERMWNLLN